MSDAIGIIETLGFAAAVQAADAMAKAGSALLVGYEKTGGGYASVIVRGELAAVRAALEVGQREAERVGRLVGVAIVPRPHESTDNIFPLGRRAL